MRGRAAHVQVLQRHPVLAVAGKRPVEHELIEGELALEDVALRETDFVLEFPRRADLGMQQEILELAAQHIPDEEIATRLTEKGYRSPMRPIVLPSTVRRIRLSHGVVHTPHQSHPRKVPGYLSVSQIAKQIGVSAHWLYDRIHNGRIQIAKDPRIRGYLFPDTLAMLDQLQQLKQGNVTQVLVNQYPDPAPACSEHLKTER